MDAVSQLILDWFASHRRHLPWRNTVRAPQSAYLIWVAETMLQQTRVETVIPYYERWIARFPDVQSLANAEEQEVLKFWEGLGYYGRARRMLQTAQLIQQQFEGKFPKHKRVLHTLPGVGPYTAAAIASMAFGQDEYVLDGNVRRVLARLWNISDPIGSIAAEKKFKAYAEQLLPQSKAGEFNQALMELGEVLCIPRQPKCDLCPLKNHCYAYQNGIQDQLPQRKRKPEIPHFNVVAAVIQRQKQVLIGKRPSKGLLGGLWEFPGGKCHAEESVEQALTREIQEELALNISIQKYIGLYRHAYTHFKVSLHAYHCRVEGEHEPQCLVHDALKWASIDELKHLPMSRLDRRIALDVERTIT